MNNVTSQIQSSIKALINGLVFINNEAADLHKKYFDTDATTKIGALAYNDPASIVGALKSQEYLSGITLTENLLNFFGNSAVTTADYLGTCHVLNSGSAVLATALSPSVENIAGRLLIMSQNLIGLLNDARTILSLYNSSQVSVLVTYLGTDKVIFGAEMTQPELSLGITLVEQFINLMTNSVVSTGDYQSTMTRWMRIS